MPRKTKDERILELSEKVASYEKQLEDVCKKNKELIEAEENSFFHSPSYIQMKENISFLKNLNELNEHQLAVEKKRTKMLDDSARLLYDDNKLLTSEKAGSEYFIGMSNYLQIKDFKQKEDQILYLNAEIEQKNLAIAARNDEIQRLQKLLADKEIKEKQCSKENNGGKEMIIYIATAPLEDMQEFENHDKIHIIVSECGSLPASILRYQEHIIMHYMKVEMMDTMSIAIKIGMLLQDCEETEATILIPEEKLRSVFSSIYSLEREDKEPITLQFKASLGNAGKKEDNTARKNTTDRKPRIKAEINLKKEAATSSGAPITASPAIPCEKEVIQVPEKCTKLLSTTDIPESFWPSIIVAARKAIDYDIDYDLQLKMQLALLDTALNQSDIKNLVKDIKEKTGSFFQDLQKSSTSRPLKLKINK